MCQRRRRDSLAFYPDLSRQVLTRKDNLELPERTGL